MIFFTQSLDTGKLPRDWFLANVAPIFKKGNRSLAENYRSVCLTCITCKLFEHIVCMHILDHVEDHQILTNLQHGFRSGRSCETQLITTTHDLLSPFNSKSQIDVAILDFSKAFDTIVSINFLGENSSNSWLWTWEFVLDLLPFLCGACGCPYNDFVICKDSKNCQLKINLLTLGMTTGKYVWRTI